MQLDKLDLNRGRRKGKRRPKRWVPRRIASYVLSWGQWEWLVVYKPFHGRALVARRPRGFPAPYTWPETWEFPDMKKRTIKAGAGAPGGPIHLAPVETKVLAKFGALIEHLVTTRYEDGEPRRVGLVMIDTMGGSWRVRVTEPDVSARLTCVSETLDGALAMAEAHLRADDAPWEVDTFAVGRSKKK